MIIVLYAITLIYYYNTFLTLFAWNYKANVSRYLTPTSRFLIIIACHDEEDVIADSLESIYRSDYDKSLYTVVIFIDNCEDLTVERCYEFINTHIDMSIYIMPVNGGSKPKAINSGIKKMKMYGLWDSDYVMILDADNKISPTLLSTYDYYHRLGSDILQCRIISDNDNGIVAMGFTSAFNNIAYGFQIARNRIGLSASLSGTGFSVRRKMFDDVGFEDCQTLTEDLEFSVKCILHGYKIIYVHEEYVKNQNLDTLRPSIIQRIRWCRGHMQVSVRLSIYIVKAFLKRPSLQLIDTFLFVNTPSKAIIYSLLILFAVNGLPNWLTWITWISMLYNFIFILKCNNFKMKYIIPHLIYAIFMHFILIYATLTYKKSKWVKTKHVKIE